MTDILTIRLCNVKPGGRLGRISFGAAGMDEKRRSPATTLRAWFRAICRRSRARSGGPGAEGGAPAQDEMRRLAGERRLHRIAEWASLRGRGL